MLEPLAARFAGLPTARPEALALSRSGLKRLTQVMEREIAAGRAPGVAMLIARHGKVGFAQSLGALTPGGPEMPLDALFRIYSMTRPIVTVAAMALVEEGRLFLTDPLAKFIPAFGQARVGDERLPLERAITIQDLMRHTSGLAYGFTGASEGHKRVRQGRFVDSTLSSAAVADGLAALPLLHQPGHVFEYGLSTDVPRPHRRARRGRLTRRGPAQAAVRTARNGRHRFLHAAGQAGEASRAAFIRCARRRGHRPHQHDSGPDLRDGRDRPDLVARRLCAVPGDALGRGARSTALARWDRAPSPSWRAIIWGLA